MMDANERHYDDAAMVRQDPERRAWAAILGIFIALFGQGVWSALIAANLDDDARDSLGGRSHGRRFCG